VRLTDRQHALELVDRHLETLQELYDAVPSADEVTIRTFWVRWAVEITLAEYRCVLGTLIRGLERGRAVIEKTTAETGPLWRGDV
jgi:hypothetical protein